MSASSSLAAHARLPASRRAGAAADADDARVFHRPAARTELFAAAAATRGTSNRLVALSMSDGDTAVPLRTRALAAWPARTDVLCLHCAERIDGTPLPAVKYYDQQDDKYWVYGYFCRPCCALAHVAELGSTTDTARCMLWTQTVLRSVFEVRGALRAAPPREALAKFGGKLSLPEFYGDDGTVFKAIHAPPFVTFAMYAEVTRKAGEGAPVDAGAVKGLRRPLVRTDAVAVAEPTEKPPLILEYLAARGAIKLPAFAADVNPAATDGRPHAAAAAAAAAGPAAAAPAAASSTAASSTAAAGPSTSTAAASGTSASTAIVRGSSSSKKLGATALGSLAPSSQAGSAASAGGGGGGLLLTTPAEPTRKPRKAARAADAAASSGAAPAGSASAGSHLGSMTLANFIVKR